MNVITACRKRRDREGAPRRASVRGALAGGVVLLVALTSFAVPLATPATAGVRLPFVGAFRGVETAVVVGPTATIDGNWTGIATQIGWFSLNNPHVVNLPTRHGCGTDVFTAANGDTVNAAGCGDATPLDPSNPLGNLFILEHVTLTGGTGRFAGASGEVTIRRLFFSADGSTVGYFFGTLATP